ncbi:hypothetical protein DKM44_06160 [Deinococcus irradiatisoli]|uniref:Uncharacterized protein n=1 Tax=Deinococcus irradiatisoli TaxID=2202254 RepID=A0A2Z3JCU9_9DEIO|nr:hypothetical protein [Deinococcus irradiatisoli]AWN22862.1 hypothetical protein DKM44_06160 [Deinococcus irradiatisoli]
MSARFPDPHHVNGFYLGQFFGLLGWAASGGGADHPLSAFDPQRRSDVMYLAELLLPWQDTLSEAQDAALARTWAYALSEFDDRDLGWFLLGHLPSLPEDPRAFLRQLAALLYPQGLPDISAQTRRLDQPNDFLFDLA